MKLVDTTFLIDFSKGKENAIKKSLELDKEFKVFCTEISVYELVVGIYALKNIDYSKKLERLEDMFRRFYILNLDHNSAIKSAEIAGQLIREGKMIGDVDSMIAGIALSNGINTIITRDKVHFERIKGIKVESY